MLRTIQSRLRAGVARAARAATTPTTTTEASTDAPSVPTDHDAHGPDGDAGPGAIADDDATQAFFRNLARDAWCPDCDSEIPRTDRHGEMRLGVTTTVCPDCCTCDH